MKKEQRMKRKMIAVFLILLLLPVSMAAEDMSAFWWDVHDTEITTVSRGTGGPRGEVLAVDWGIFYYSKESAQAYYSDIDDMLQEWEVWEAPEWETKSRSLTSVDDRLLQCVLWSEEPKLEYSFSDQVAWRVRAVVLDMGDWERVNLSDIFYDDVNYIRYINGQVMLALYENPWISDDYTPVTEEMQRRPFSGFPRDYPYFRIKRDELGRRVLELLVNYENPLFATNLTYRYPAIQIPLMDSVSPYGQPWVDVIVDTSNSPFHVVQIALPKEKDPHIAEKVNAGLLKASQQALEHPVMQEGAQQIRQTWEDYGTPMMPRVNVSGKYISVRYYGNERYREGDQATIAAAAFDLETGEAVDGRALWEMGMKVLEQVDIPEEEDWRDKPLHMIGEEILDGFRAASVGEGHTMPPSSEMTYIGCYAWGIEGDGVAIIYFDTEKNVEYCMYLSRELLRGHGLLP